MRKPESCCRFIPKTTYFYKKNTIVGRFILARCFYNISKDRKSDGPLFHYAISVRRKNGNAVKRNKFKRRLRHILFSFWKSNLEWQHSGELFIFLSLKRKVVIPLIFNELMDDLFGILRRLMKKTREKEKAKTSSG
ncbi:ribonuclease P protein component [Candidatus Riflebacteria bacterium]